MWIYYFMQLKWTPLYAAADAGHIKIVQYLIEERGCDSAVLDLVNVHLANFITYGSPYISIFCIGGNL